MTTPRKSDATLQQKPTITTSSNVQPIGVPPNYVALDATPQQIAEQQYLATHAGPQMYPSPRLITPQFFEGDDWQPASYSPDRIADLQQALVDAGALTDKYRKGVWDDASRAAYRDILGFANASGLSPEQAITRWGQATEQADRKKPFEPLPFREPDPAALRVKVKSAFKSILPRELSETEIDSLTKNLHDFVLQQHQAEEGQRRADYAVAGTGATPAAVPEADAEARFRELLADRYKPEIKFVGDQEQTAEQQQAIGKSLLTLGGLMSHG